MPDESRLQLTNLPEFFFNCSLISTSFGFSEEALRLPEIKGQSTENSQNGYRWLTKPRDSSYGRKHICNRKTMSRATTAALYDGVLISP